jgi:hypothetical protein
VNVATGAHKVSKLSELADVPIAAAKELRTRRQSENSKADRPDDFARGAAPSEQVEQVGNRHEAVSNREEFWIEGRQTDKQRAHGNRENG